MRKIKVLTACLIMAILVTGVTYAAWSRQLNINGTVNTGNLGFEWDEKNCSIGTFDRDRRNGNQIQASLVKKNANTLEVTMANIYPGAGIVLDALGRNTGTIPAKFKNATLSFSGDTEVVQYLKSNGKFAWSKDGAAIGTQVVIQQPDPVTGVWPSFDQFDDDMNTVIPNDVVINPGGWFSLDKAPTPDSPNCIYIKLDENAPKSISGKTVTFTLTANFEQAQ